MREILFRGKRCDNGEWVEGYYAGYGLICAGEPEDTYNATGDYYGLTPYVGFVEVNPAAVGQYTGLTDKNGKRIFEGDIVRTQPFYDRVYSRKGKTKTHVGVVEYYIFPEYRSEWCVSIKDYQCFPICDWSAFYQCEVIGNIHDNPELLGGEENAAD